MPAAARSRPRQTKVGARSGPRETDTPANLATVDSEELRTPPERIGAPAIWLTVLDGRVVYSAGRAWAPAARRPGAGGRAPSGISER